MSHSHSPFVFSRRSRTKLLHVHPDLVLAVSRCLLYSEIDFGITEGLRTLERQRELLASGRSRTLNSNHLLQDDGFSHAVDVMASGDLNRDGVVDHKDRAVTWDRKWYGEIAQAMERASEELRIGIRWGGTFRGFYDGPHFELA